MGGKLDTVGAHGQQTQPQAAQPLPFGRAKRGTALTTVHALNSLPSILERLNDAAKRKVLALQEYFVLAWNALRFIFARPFYGGDLVQQMDAIGVQSLGIVLLTGFFTGMVLALQSALQLQAFGASMYMGRLVAASMIRELGPVLAGLMVADNRAGHGECDVLRAAALKLQLLRITKNINPWPQFRGCCFPAQKGRRSGSPAQLQERETRRSKGSRGLAKDRVFFPGSLTRHPGFVAVAGEGEYPRDIQAGVGCSQSDRHS